MKPPLIDTLPSLERMIAAAAEPGGKEMLRESLTSLQRSRDSLAKARDGALHATPAGHTLAPKEQAQFEAGSQSITLFYTAIDRIGAALGEVSA